MSTASVYETRDGGQSWTKRITVQSGFIGDITWSGQHGAINVIDNRSATSPVHLILSTSDAGETWTLRRCEVNVIALSDRATVGITRGHLYVSEDGGDSWRESTLPQGFEARQAIILGSGQRLAAIMESNTSTGLFVTTDGGTTWSVAEGINAPALLSQGPSGTAWVLAENAVWISEDSGVTWTPHDLPKSKEGQWSVSRLEVVDGAQAWIKLLDRNLFLFTDDKGVTWSEISPPSEANTSASFGLSGPGPGVLYVIGDWPLNRRGGSSLWRTLNKGESWKNVSSFRSSSGGGGG